MTTITLNYYAGAAEAAGHLTETFHDQAGSLAEFIAALGQGNPTLVKVLQVSSFLVNGQQIANHDRPLSDFVADDNCVHIDVLPPFAGG